LKRRVGILEAHPEHDVTSGLLDLGRELGSQPALADPGLTGDDRDSRGPGETPPPQLPQPSTLVDATDEARRLDQQLEHGGKTLAGIA
jgi:hypothetical protein